MIRVKDSVPSVYYDKSRDFQLLGHLFDLVLNSIKTEADILFSLPYSMNSPDQLLDLLAYTLGLKLDKSKYSARQLRAICSVAPQMMKSKGSRRAVELLCTALMNADQVKEKFDINIEKNELTVYISKYATCGAILREILPYIVPAGMVFNIKQTTPKLLQTFNLNAETSIVTFSDTVRANTQDTKGMIATAADISRIFNTTGSLFEEDGENGLTLQPGLIFTADVSVPSKDKEGESQ